MGQVVPIPLDMCEEEIEERLLPKSVISQDSRILDIYNKIERVAPTPATVLICGETGTGKELIANAIHMGSKRRDYPFVAINCAALPSDVIESELFGHERGSFTGAMERKIGKFELASGGTLFLDEIGSMPLAQQAKILRAIESRRIYRIGGKYEIGTDTRIVAATNQPLEYLVQRKEFRQDLLYRLNVMRLNVPPLRERKGDIPILATYFIRKYCDAFERQRMRLSNGAMHALMQYNWPGNVRELENLLEGLAASADPSSCRIERDDICPECAPAIANPFDDYKGTLSDIVEAFESQYLVYALEKYKWSQTDTAKGLGVHRNTLLQKARKYRISMRQDMP